MKQYLIWLPNFKLPSGVKMFELSETIFYLVVIGWKIFPNETPGSFTRKLSRLPATESHKMLNLVYQATSKLWAEAIHSSLFLKTKYCILLIRLAQANVHGPK